MNDINNKITLSASDLEDIVCPNCGNKYFKNILRLKKVSALYSPTGQETMMPIPVIACEKCDHIVKDLED
tara:strand:- start:341 stop:550 length:210 start_codon:yes stop_codon:yes gene_type:complete